MRPHLARVERLLRASLLAMLVLGLMIHPVLSGLSELHASEHALALERHADDFADSRTDSHGDLHGHMPHHDRMPHPDDTTPTDDHASGSHGLMHQPCGHASLDLVGAIGIPSAVRLTANPPDPVRSGRPQPPPSTLFRPPIV